MNNLISTLIMWVSFIILCLFASYIFLLIKQHVTRGKHHTIRVDLPQRITTTTSLLSLIDSLITTEIINQEKTVFFSQDTKYDYRKLDIDIAEISQNVFNALSKDVFTKNNREIVITDDYIMTYITKRSIELLLETVTKYNSTII